MESDLGGEAGVLQYGFVRAIVCDAYGMCMSSCSSASLFSSGSASKRSVHVFCTTLLPALGSDSFNVLMAEKSICS